MAANPTRSAPTKAGTPAFPGETAGRLRSPASWSARSAPTIAIGHELAVTPLQLALAYGAIANGGASDASVLDEAAAAVTLAQLDGAVRAGRASGHSWPG